MKEIYFVTGNTGKIASAKKYSIEYGLDMKTIDLKIVEPEVNDIELIAKKKVEEAYSLIQKPCVADDSGFYIESFPDKSNFPGAFVKRQLLEPLGIHGLLDKMSTVENRNCYFDDCVAYYDGNEYVLFHSLSKGVLSTEIRGDNLNGAWSPLWYVFIPEGYNKTLAEMTNEERTERSNNKESAMKNFIKWYTNTHEKRMQ